MNKKSYLITRMDGYICSFLMQDGRAVEIHRDSFVADDATETSPNAALQTAHEDDKNLCIGDIYIGKIKNIARQIGAAFVEVSPGKVCHLSLRDAVHPVFTKKGSSAQPQEGDELLVQISRDSIKSKYPSVTTNLTLYGKYVLLTTGNTRLSVSAKLNQTEKTRLLEVINEILGRQTSEACQKDGDTYGWLVRTNAKEASDERIRDDVLRLKAQGDRLIAQARYRTCFSCLLRTPPRYLTRLQDLYSTEADAILTDDEVLFTQIKEYLSQYQPEDLGKLQLYKDHLLPMQKLYALERQLSMALSEKVWLKSGGYLVIQPTEALTAIDVNTGKCSGGKNQEATFLKINKEAAVEIARQLRLRNLSGIIIADFINMKSKEAQKELLHLLDVQLKQDPIPTALIDMTKLSLVEITRMKREKPLA